MKKSLGWLASLVFTLGCGSVSSSSSDGAAGGGSGGSGGATAGAGGHADAGAGGSGGAGAGGAGGAGGHAGAGGSGGTGGHAGAGGSGGTGGHAGAGGSGGTGGAGGVGSTLPVCPGAVAIPAAQKTCRTSMDCGPWFGICGPTYSAPGCGACLQAPHECGVDGDCGTGRVCVPGPSGGCVCPGPNGPSTVCVAKCTATSCTSAEICNDATGHCQVRLCTAGYACATGYVCATTRTDADPHGCAIARCATDGFTCPEGFTCTGTVGNGCAAVSCVGGAYKCPVNTDCKAGSSSLHLCERRPCTSDAACDCGACIQGHCEDHLWVCSYPAA
jgi:hypothetical protein